MQRPSSKSPGFLRPSPPGSGSRTQRASLRLRPGAPRGTGSRARELRAGGTRREGAGALRLRGRASWNRGGLGPPWVPWSTTARRTRALGNPWCSNSGCGRLCQSSGRIPRVPALLAQHRWMEETLQGGARPRAWYRLSKGPGSPPCALPFRISWQRRSDPVGR